MDKEPREYIVEQRQVGGQCWIVDATSQADAIRRVKAGEGAAVGFEITSTGSYTAVASGREGGLR